MEAPKARHPFAKLYKKLRDGMIKVLVFISTEFEYRRFLHNAVENRDISLLEYMLTRGIDVNLRDEVYDWTPLHGAARCSKQDSHYEVTEVLLRHGAGLNLKDQYGKTALHYLVTQGNDKTVQLILDFEVDFNVKDYRGEKPLFYAITSGNTESAQLLINHGADLERTILHKAVRRDNHLEVVKLLLANGAKVNARDKHGNSPLHYVVRRPCDLETVRLLLEYKADVHLKNEKGEVALFRAVKSGCTETVQLLIEKGSDVNSCDRDGATCLQAAVWACQNDSHCPAIEALLKAGADSEVDGLLHCLVCHNSPGAIGLILNYSADVNARGSHGETALFNAISFGGVEIIKLLLERGSDANCPGWNGVTPLHKAVMHHENQLTVAEMLLRKGANVNAQDTGGKTALHYLAKTQRSLRTAELLLNFGARVAVKDNKGKVPLMNAVKSGNFKVALLLLDQGSDVNTSCDLGLTPLHLAAMNSDKRMLKLLLEKGADADAVDFKGRTALLRLPRRSAELKMMLKYSDPGVLDYENKSVLDIHGDDAAVILGHFAKFQVLGLPINPDVMRDKILGNSRYRDYFGRCVEELGLAKKTKLHNSWVTYFNLLVDGDRKLKNYAGNEDLVEDFKSKGYKHKFPVYGIAMLKNMSKGIERRKLFDEAAGKLSDCLGIFGEDHLVVRDVLDCVRTKDLAKFCERNLN